jgi:hypothetical protein
MLSLLAALLLPAAQLPSAPPVPPTAAPLAQAIPNNPQQAEPDALRNRDRPEDEIPLAPPTQPRRLIRLPYDMRPLPGQLDSVPVFNSNSPEVVRTEGILLSTFPNRGMRVPSAHLNYPFEGRFDIFSHHISRASATEEGRTLFHGILVYNPGPRPATVEILDAASYISRFEAPFRPLLPYIEDPNGTVFSGAGSRVVNDILRNRRRGLWRTPVTLEPRQADMIANVPIPVGRITPSSNTRSTLVRLRSSAPVYLAAMAMFSPKTPDGRETIPPLRAWQVMLVNGGLSGPRDARPTPPGQNPPQFFYGRVAGVAMGSKWEATATDPGRETLGVPDPGKGIGYPIASLPRGTLGTGQNQSAAIVARYPDTAYQAHGNYGIHYDLTLPLENRSGQSKRVAVLLHTPLKEDRLAGGLGFFAPPEERVFYRGTVRVRYVNDQGQRQERFIHVVHHRGERGEPLVEVNLAPNERRSVRVDLIYPPDATPPQVLAVETLR